MLSLIRLADSLFLNRTIIINNIIFVTINLTPGLWVNIPLIVFSVLVAMAIGSCQQKKVVPVQKELPVHLQGTIIQNSPIDFDSSEVVSFFQSHPELAKYQADVAPIYRKYNFHTIWFDENGVVEFGNSLYSKIMEL